MIEGWPLYFADSLTLGRTDSPVAICCLWLRQDGLARRLGDTPYAVLGNLYSRHGINYLLRNLLARPSLRYLLLYGVDLTGSGQALRQLFERGLDSHHRIRGDGTQIQRELPPEAIELVRQGIRLIDLRHPTDPARRSLPVSDLLAAIAGLEQPVPPFAAAPQVFPESQPQVAILPAEEAAFVVRGAKVAHVWLQALHLVMTYGQVDETQHSSRQREIIDLMAVITDEDPDHPHLEPYLPFTREQLEGQLDALPGQLPLPLPLEYRIDQRSYYASVMAASRPAEGVSYTYGERLLAFRSLQSGDPLAVTPINQVESMVALLRQARYTRRALAVLWDPAKDLGSDNPPCLDLVQVRLREERLLMTAYFRSHDLYAAWAANVFALRKLQQEIARDVDGCQLGPLVIVSHSAHVYEHDWEQVEKLLARHYPTLQRRQRLQQDPRGSFFIRLEGEQIVVDHFSPAGDLLGTFKGESAAELGQQLAPLVSLTGHALYLGRELQKAELALKQGLPYHQD